MENDNIKRFRELNVSTNSEVVNVINIDGLPHKLGLSSKGFPMFFVVTSENQFPTHNIEREFLSVQFDLPCTIVLENQDKKDNKFTIITLKNEDTDLQNSFIEIFILMLHKLAPDTTKRNLSIELENLITIFSALSLPPKKKIQGLWAELLVIEQSSNPELLLSNWHTQPNSKYDFSNGRDKIEVKSTSSEERLHRFSLDQLNPSTNSNLLIASAVVRECAQSESGLSIYDLYNRIIEQVPDNDLRLHCYSIIVETLGDSLPKSKKVFFDYVEASDSLAFFNALYVPKIEKSCVPNDVTDVKFMSNLTHLSPVSRQTESELIENSALFNSIL
jgi:hypothetical protein